MTHPLSSGLVYIVKRNDLYKIGVSRSNVRRRAKYAGGDVFMVLPGGRFPFVLENRLHKRFAHKHAEGPKSKREWFTLDNDDLLWLAGLAAHLQNSLSHV